MSPYFVIARDATPYAAIHIKATYMKLDKSRSYEETKSSPEVFSSIIRNYHTYYPDTQNAYHIFYHKYFWAKDFHHTNEFE